MLDSLKFWKNYPIEVNIYERRHGSPIKTEDRAVRITEDDGHEYYKLKNKGDRIKPPDYEHIIPNKNGNSTIHLLKTGSNEYHTWRPEFKDEEIESNLIEDKRERLNWLIQEKERIEDKYTLMSWMAEHKEVIVIIGTGLALAFTFYGAAKLFGQIGPQVQQLTEQLSITNQLLEQTPGGAPP